MSIRADMTLRDIDYRAVQLNNLVVSLTVNEVHKHKLIIIKFEVNFAIWMEIRHLLFYQFRSNKGCIFHSVFTTQHNR